MKKEVESQRNHVTLTVSYWSKLYSVSHLLVFITVFHRVFISF